MISSSEVDPPSRSRGDFWVDRGLWTTVLLLVDTTDVGRRYIKIKSVTSNWRYDIKNAYLSVSIVIWSVRMCTSGRAVRIALPAVPKRTVDIAPPIRPGLSLETTAPTDETYTSRFVNSCRRTTQRFAAMHETVAAGTVAILSTQC